MKKDKLSRAELLLNENKPQEALRLCKSICRKNKTNVDAWGLLGMIYGRLGDFSEAEKSFEQIVRIQPKLAEGYFNLGKCQQSLNKWQEAEQNYSKATQLNPTFAQAFNNLGAMKISVAKVGEAEECFLKAIEIQPNYPMAYRNLGLLYQQQERLEEAENAFLKALELKPDFLNVVSSLADIMMAAGRYDDAKKQLFYAHKLQPENPSSYANLGKFYYSTNNYEEAKAQYSMALVKQSDFLPALMGLGASMQKTGEFVSAKECYRKVLALQSENYQALNNLGVVLTELAEYQDAKDCLEKALKINSTRADIFINFSNALSKLGELDSAIKVLKNALELEPENVDAHIKLASMMLSQGKAKEADQCYRNALGIKSELAESMNAHLLPMNYCDLYTRQEIYEAHVKWGAKQESANSEKINFENLLNTDRKLRIGYVSPDFRNHSVAFFLEPIITNHNKEKFEIYCYSDVPKQDAVTERIKNKVDYWRQCYAVSNEKVEAMVRNDKIDILVDLAGHTQGNRLVVFAKRVAPVQVSYLGYPNTTGLKSMDYLITDEHCDPIGIADPFYTESLVRISQAFYCYKPPTDAPDILSLPATDNGYITFASYNNLVKISEDVIELWSKVLMSMPGSKMLIQNHSFNDSSSKERIEKLFMSHGVVAERLVLQTSSDFSSYLVGHNQVDIILDTFPWAGHTITCHALMMGVPVITLVGEEHASRMGYSTMQNLGLCECIAFTKEEYLEKAIALANNLPWLDEMRKQLRPALLGSHLCDGIQFTQKLEDQYQVMWRTCCEKA